MAKKKNPTKVIRNITDLVDLVNHNTNILEKSIVKLAKKNRNLKFLCVIAVGTSIYTMVKQHKQEEMVYQLFVRVKKLENSEGENTM